MQSQFHNEVLHLSYMIGIKIAYSLTFNLEELGIVISNNMGDIFIGRPIL